MVDKIDTFILGGLAGCLIGFASLTIFPDRTNDKIKVIQKDNYNILKIERDFRGDGLYIQNKKDIYILLEDYLNKIPNKYDRKIEESKIKKRG